MLFNDFLMIIMMILHMDDNILLYMEMLSFLIMISFILFHFRGVVMLEFDVKMSDVFLYAVPVMIYY